MSKHSNMVFTRFITKNGKRIYAKKGKVFAFPSYKSKKAAKKS